MGSSVENTVVRARAMPEPLHLVNWPLRDDRLWSSLFIAALVGVASLCGSFASNLLLGVMSFLVLATAAWRLWVPVSFTLSSRGIVETVLGRDRRVSWPQIARYKIYNNGLLLLADAQATPFESLRGVYIRWSGRRDELLELVHFFLDARQPAESS